MMSTLEELQALLQSRTNLTRLCQGTPCSPSAVRQLQCIRANAQLSCLVCVPDIPRRFTLAKSPRSLPERFRARRPRSPKSLPRMQRFSTSERRILGRDSPQSVQARRTGSLEASLGAVVDLHQQISPSAEKRRSHSWSQIFSINEWILFQNRAHCGCRDEQFTGRTGGGVVRKSRQSGKNLATAAEQRVRLVRFCRKSMRRSIGL